MTRLDLMLRNWRARKALAHISRGSRLLDIGTHDGALFQEAAATGLGIDPELATPAPLPRDVELVSGFFPVDLPPQPQSSFDAAVALAVVEHVPDGELTTWADSLHELLRPGGRFVLTVPAPAVDHILHVLMRLRLVDGMEAHQHHGFLPQDLLGIFTAPRWHLVKHRRFQLGLNHLFVFERR